MTAITTPSYVAAQAETLVQQYQRIRKTTSTLCAPLSAEDMLVQSMPEASPGKWHLAHTTWFFERFLLASQAAYKPINAGWLQLFNSYYQSVGPLPSRAGRGLLSRPSLAEVLDYHQRIDERMYTLLASAADTHVRNLLALGLNHEQQHQELLLTDIKHAFSLNPIEPAYKIAKRHSTETAQPLGWIRGFEGLSSVGHQSDNFAFDNEMPRHRVLLHPHAIASRPVNNAEFIEFIHAGGYRTPQLWMAEGWDIVQKQDWQRPLYWAPDLQSHFTLGGRVAIDPAAPVCHVSFFEADAFARWAGARLPTEAEWENIAITHDSHHGNFLDNDYFQPQAPSQTSAQQATQLFGDVWEWTSSPYVNYPGYRPLEGALGEYNGKFMCGQWVLRGGSCVTSRDHIRASYRNFFYPADRWQFMGFRLGKDV